MALGNALIGFDGTAATTAKVAVIRGTSASSVQNPPFNVTYSGTKYAVGSNFSADIGSTITINLTQNTSNRYNQIYVNGSLVKSGTATAISYNYTVQTETHVTYEYSTEKAGFTTRYYNKAYITTSTLGYESSITDGKVLVNYDGTPSKNVVEVTGENDTSLFVTYNNTNYYAGDTFTISAGDSITVNLNKTGLIVHNYVYVDGASVANSTANALSYAYTVSRSTTVKFVKQSSYYYAYISKTTSSYGPAYSILKGKTLINNIAYNIGSVLVDVVITGSGVSYSTIRASCTIGGVTYSSATTGLEVEPGDVITFTVNAASAAGGTLVKINGEAVISSTGPDGTSYDWTVPNGIRNVDIALSTASDGSFGMITVTAA